MRRITSLVATFVVLAVVVVSALLAIKSIRRNSTSVEAASTYVPQDISRATFNTLGEFAIRAEQDNDAPLKIVDARVNAITGDHYHELTGQPARVGEVISAPQVVLQNTSNKTVTGISLIISDKAANIKRGIYIKEQSIRPGQRFTIRPENFVRVGGNPASNPKFWLDAADKTQVVVRVVAFFDDGSMWANKDQRY
jgi:hypothetical protein